MYAIIKTGGKQYRVTEGDTLRLEKLTGEEGDTVTFDHVMLIGGDKTTVGTPKVEGASVTGKVIAQARGEKVLVFKKRRRKNSRRLNGHRQYMTVVKIEGIHAA